MGAEVTFEAIRKSDYIPFVSLYLGGNETARTIKKSGKSTIGIDEFDMDEFEIVSLGNWKEAIDFIVLIEESFYAGNHGNEAISFINKYQDKMAYFLRVG